MATSTTRTQLRRSIAKLIRDPMHLDLPSGFFLASASSTATAIQPSASHTGLWNYENRWSRSWAYAVTGNNAGEERRITAYTTAGNGTITVQPAFTSATWLTTHEVELFSRVPGTLINETINRAIREAWPHWWTLTTSTVVIPKNVVELTTAHGLATDAKKFLNIYLEPQRNQSEEYTATGGAAGYIEDTTQAWTLNEHAGKSVAIIDGTGAGQERTISSNTTTGRAVVSSSWTTTPDSTSVFVIKDELESGVWSKEIRFNFPGGPEKTSLHLPAHLTAYPGRTLKIETIGPPSTLASDSATTSISPDYLQYRAASMILMEMGTYSPSANADTEMRLGATYMEMAERLRARQEERMPTGTYFLAPRRGRAGWSSDSPFYQG